MEYGLIGEHLSHSYSKEIHENIAGYKYELVEVKPECLPEFIKKREFLGINVTIPYKQAVIPMLDEISETALKIGAVNTIVNKGGILKGYNTDYFGMRELIKKENIEVKGAKVLILGTGGTSNTACTLFDNLGAGEIIKVSRTEKTGSIIYSKAQTEHIDADIIINTTPAGMYPDIDTCLIDLSKFKNLKRVIDAVYNPLKTELLLRAEEQGIKAIGGLYMLTAQAIKAIELFTGKCSYDLTEKAYKDILSCKRNIVLIGMPGSGKTTIGKKLSDILNKEYIDTDAIIEERIGMTIKDFFFKYGEGEFRRIEKQIIKEISVSRGAVISTGGGVILDPDNIRNLKRNGKIVFLDRPLSMLVPYPDRPLSKDEKSLKKRYNERYEIYLSSADIAIDAGKSIDEVTDRIIKEINK